jgi:hypothetical protein
VSDHDICDNARAPQVLRVGGFKPTIRGDHQEPIVRRSLGLYFRREFDAGGKRC